MLCLFANLDQASKAPFGRKRAICPSTSFSCTTIFLLMPTRFPGGYISKVNENAGVLRVAAKSATGFAFAKVEQCLK